MGARPGSEPGACRKSCQQQITVKNVFVEWLQQSFAVTECNLEISVFDKVQTVFTL